MTRTAAEPPAIETVEGTPPATGRARTERDRLQRQIETGEHQLTSTRQQLAGLGWTGRRRHGPVLRAQIYAQQRALAELRLKLRELPAAEPHLQLPAIDRPRAPPARERALQHQIERGMGLER
jgi:hypothetical protein